MEHFKFSGLNFQVEPKDVWNNRPRLGSESEEYFSDDSPQSPAYWTPLDDFKCNGRDCDLDSRAPVLPPMSPVMQMEQMLLQLQLPSSASAAVAAAAGMDSVSEVVATKHRLVQILQHQQGQAGDRSRQQGRAFRALGLDSNSRGGMSAQTLVCVFCRNNQETPAVYTSHRLKDDIGQVVCPVLYAYTCPICGASGPVAHTIKYCPLNIGGELETSIVNQLKTLRKSAGRRR